MTHPDKPVLVYTTCPATDMAESIGAALVDQGLAACVNIFPGMTSIYIWQGERHRDSEVVMIVKTMAARADAAMAAIRERHPYSNPALLVLAVDGGSADFVAWIAEQTASQPSSSKVKPS